MYEEEGYMLKSSGTYFSWPQSLKKREGIEARKRDDDFFFFFVTLSVAMSQSGMEVYKKVKTQEGVECS